MEPRRSTGCAAAATTCAAFSDITSANIFESNLADEEYHVDYLETRLGLIEQLYLAQVIEQPGG